MDQAGLSELLGITGEDAAFLEQVLAEVASEAGSSNENNSVAVTESVIEQANENPIMQKILTEDNESTSRFSSAIWYEKIQQQTIILAGLGGIGGYCAYLLSRMNPTSIFIYDDDVVETANLSGQMFRQEDVGSLKTVAVRNLMRSFSNYGDVFSIERRFDSTSQAGNIMICGFDNMEARRTFFHRWKSHVEELPDDIRKECLFIDGRLAAESFQVFCIKGTDLRSMQIYEEQWLFNDDEAEETICSYKQTSFCANMIASVMINCFVNFIANQCDPLIPRDVPFFTEYDASMMFFKTES